MGGGAIAPSPAVVLKTVDKAVDDFNFVKTSLMHSRAGSSSASSA